MINKQKPVEKLLKDLRGFIPDDSIKDALTSNGVLVDYLRLLKDMKAQLNNVQSFLEAHINLLEDIKAQPQQKQDAASFSVAGNPNDGCYRTASFENDGCYDNAQVTVKYKMVVSGTTFDAHLQILNQVKSSAQQLNLVESQSSEESQIVLVFCPIVSRVGTDVEGAMKMVMGETLSFFRHLD
ncbi:uncharacterized protein FYW61_020232 [Anableps anableps]